MLAETIVDQSIVEENIALVLAEDIGAGDITAALIDESLQAKAVVISRESTVLCGQPWFDAVYQQLDPAIKIQWQISEGEAVKADQPLVELSGAAQTLLTGERVALNWLQSLSATATVTSQYVAALKNTSVKLLDTRKTIPGMRYAQKYAVKIGGGHNHRFGLYDAYLIKENHIMSCGSIEKAISRARELQPKKTVEVEVESLEELQQALMAGADIIMLDNFTLENMREAVTITNARAKLEVSGNVTLDQLKEIAQTGIDFISVGALTKHVRAIDLSMRFV